MKRTALFPGSFDPFTLGHVAVVKQALSLFDKVVIGVGKSNEKRCLLSVENRVRLIADLYATDKRIEVLAYDCLTGDLCREMDVKTLIRGMRNSVDFEYERGIATVNHRLYPEVTTIFLSTPPQYIDISSSVIRELVSYGRNVDDLMPEGIALEKYL